MITSDLLNKSVTVKRLTGGFGGDPDKSDYQTVATLSGNLQQATAEEAALADGDFGKVWNLFIDRGANIKESDRVTIDNVDYTVKGIHDRDIPRGNIQHLQV